MPVTCGYFELIEDMKILKERYEDDELERIRTKLPKHPEK